MEKLYYYRLEKAREIRQSFTSWIGKHAHIGNGKTAILKAIIIKPKRAKTAEKLYRMIFEFESRFKLSGYEFLFYNGLIHPPESSDLKKPRQGTAA